jgi:hypothetical protein
MNYLITYNAYGSVYRRWIDQPVAFFHRHLQEIFYLVCQHDEASYAWCTCTALHIEDFKDMPAESMPCRETGRSMQKSESDSCLDTGRRIREIAFDAENPGLVKIGFFLGACL